MVRDLVAEKARAVAGVGLVHTQRFYIGSKQQYVEKFGAENPNDGNLEVRYLLIEFMGYEDTLKGCEDAPHYKLVYSLRAVQEFKDSREDGSSSSDEHAAFVMNLRAKFLTGRDLGFPERLLHDHLLMTDRSRVDDDELSGAHGHIAPFVLKVEVVPAG